MAKKEEYLYKPLLIFYDCEAANGNLFSGDIIEIAARSALSGIDLSFESLIKTEKKLCWFAVEKCGMTEDKLSEEPFFPETINKFFKWIQRTIKKANRQLSCKHFPVICAHGGFTFDFIMLLSNMERNNIDHNIIRKMNLHFADTFEYCKELQASNFKELSGVRLSMDSLFSQFCPKKSFTNRHRAMGDVNAMVDIFSTGPLKDSMVKINSITAETMCKMYGKQFSYKEQKLILEEKMSKLDAYTRCINTKKLLEIHLTFEGIQRLFENCCSFTDFFEAMKDHGIDRKTAKYFACQFGGLGLKNQATVPYCAFIEPKVHLDDDVGEKNETVVFEKNEKVFEDEISKNENYQRPANVPEVPPDEFQIEESSECWEDEIDPNRSFVITLIKPAPMLSVTIDEFVSPSAGKQDFKSVDKHNADNIEKVNQTPSAGKQYFKSVNKHNTNNIEKVNKKNKRFSKKKSAFQKSKKKEILFSGKENYELNTEIPTENSTGKNKDSYGGDSEIPTENSTDKNKDFCGDSTSNDGRLLDEKCGQEEVASFEDVNTEAHSGSCAVESTKDQGSKEQSQVAHDVSSQVECVSKIAQIDYNIDDPTTCRTSTKKIDTSKAACVMFKDKEMEEQLMNWPRVKILVGDIPIYVPVDPSISEEEETTAQNTDKSCNNNHVGKEQKAVIEDDTSKKVVSLTCANERCSVLHDGKVLSSESSDTEDSSPRLISKDNILCDNQYPMCCEPSNVCQPLRYFEPYTSGTSPIMSMSSPGMSPRYVNPFHPQPRSFYPMNMHHMTSQQLFHAGTNTPGEFRPRPNNPRYASKMVQDFYCARVRHHNHYKQY